MTSNCQNIDGLLYERRDSIANALELGLFCTKPSIWSVMKREIITKYSYSFIMEYSKERKNNNTLQCRHNGRYSVSNYQPHDCLLNRLFRRRSKKNQSSASLAFVWGIHRWLVNSPHKGPVTRKMFPFDDVIMNLLTTPVRFCRYKRVTGTQIWGMSPSDHCCCHYSGTSQSFPVLHLTWSSSNLQGAEVTWINYRVPTL